MDLEQWRIYNHAAIPAIPPHEKLSTDCIHDGRIWNMGKKAPLLVRWITEFDCGHETNWWYVIKDTPFEISGLKSNRRYKINKGKKYFHVCIINPNEYKEELYNVSLEAYRTYPKKYRPSISHDTFVNSVSSWKTIVYGAIHRESGRLCGYAQLNRDGKFVDLSVVKVIPEFEKLQINAAIVEKILEDHREFLLDGGYICDGSRNISHETAYQDYLESYFGFRKAYCNLHVEYNPKIKWIVRLIFPLRKILSKFDDIKLIHQVNSILKMEVLVREKNE